MLDRETILGADDLPRECVEVPEWGGSVYVRSLMGHERDALVMEWRNRRTKGTTNLVGLTAYAVALTACDDKGKRLFEEKDAKALSKKSGAALDRIWQVVARLNHLLEEDVEDMAGNSSSGRSDTPGSS